MTFMQQSEALIRQRGEIAKQNLGSFITDKIVDEVTEDLINKLRILLIIDKVRLN